MRSERVITAIVLAIALAAGAAVARAEIIDRVMAVVGGELITLSDVRAAMEFRLVEVPKTPDPVGDALDRLIERQLVLGEVERYLPPEPPDQTVADRVEQIRLRYKTPQALAAALESSGLTDARLSDLVRDNVRIERYLEQRFAGTAQPSDRELDDYYREHADDFASGGVHTPSRPGARDRAAASGGGAPCRAGGAVDRWPAPPGAGAASLSP